MAGFPGSRRLKRRGEAELRLDLAYPYGTATQDFHGEVAGQFQIGTALRLNELFNVVRSSGSDDFIRTASPVELETSTICSNDSASQLSWRMYWRSSSSPAELAWDVVVMGNGVHADVAE